MGADCDPFGVTVATRSSLQNRPLHSCGGEIARADATVVRMEVHAIQVERDGDEKNFSLRGTIPGLYPRCRYRHLLCSPIFQTSIRAWIQRLPFCLKG